MTTQTTPIYGLALHTSSQQLGLAIAVNGEIRRSQTWELGRELSNQLHLYLAEFIQPQTWSDMAYLAVAQGPGSFTSIRIGLVTARTLGQQLHIPVFTLSSLAAFALSQVDHLSPSGLIAVQMAATRGQIYGAVYQIHAQSIKVIFSDRLLDPPDWQRQLAQIDPDLHPLLAPEALGQNVDQILLLAHQSWQAGQRSPWSEALPFYGMSP
jgi:tRNA threonylcarbamoyl adenosine modification protein YeaZ